MLEYSITLIHHEFGGGSSRFDEENTTPLWYVLTSAVLLREEGANA